MLLLLYSIIVIIAIFKNAEIKKYKGLPWNGNSKHQQREFWLCHCPFHLMPLKVRCPYICKMPLQVKSPQKSDEIYQMPLFVRGCYFSDAPICQIPLYFRCPYMSDAPICKIPVSVRCPYISDTPICQTPLYVRCPYRSST